MFSLLSNNNRLNFSPSFAVTIHLPADAEVRGNGPWDEVGINAHVDFLYSRQALSVLAWRASLDGTLVLLPGKNDCLDVAC